MAISIPMKSGEDCIRFLTISFVRLFDPMGNHKIGDVLYLRACGETEDQLRERIKSKIGGSLITDDPAEA